MAAFSSRGPVDDGRIKPDISHQEHTFFQPNQGQPPTLAGWHTIPHTHTWVEQAWQLH